jgi:predicted CopG family antitoxin
MATGKRNKTISLTLDTYEKLCEMGDMKTTFNDVVVDLMKKANVINTSAGALKED